MRQIDKRKKLKKYFVLLIVLMILMPIIPKKVYAISDKDKPIAEWFRDNRPEYANGTIKFDLDSAVPLINAMRSAKGVEDIKIENNKLVIVTYKDIQPNTVKGNIQAALQGVISQSDVDILFSGDDNEVKQGNNSSTGNNGNNGNDGSTPESPKTQFENILGKDYPLSSGTLDALWEAYEDGKIGETGKQMVEVKTDADGNITEVILNLSEAERNSYGISDQASMEIEEAQKDPKTGLEGEDQGDIGGVLFEPVSWLLQGAGDMLNKMMQRVFIGTWDPVFYTTGFLWSETDIDKVISENPADGNLQNVTVVKKYIEGIFGGYGVPDIKLTPAEIFAGNVAALDANFFETNANVANKLGGESHSIVVQLKPIIAQWYVALRNIAIVGLLSVLLYVGIRIVTSSTAGDKAKYKQLFVDWVVALCLIFFMHYIMSFTMTMSETITDVLAGETTQDGTIKQVNIVLTDTSGASLGKDFSSNFTGVARIKADYQDSALKMGYSVLYLALTGYTVYFAFVYLKRLLMLAFFTMIAPLVALTYPIDKVKDGKAQAFNYWFKEYMFYALLQPMHMILYTVLIGTALSIATNNLLYAIVALAFIVPAEKILKQMFGIKGQTESSLGGFAGGALASQAFNALTKTLGKGKGGQGGGSAGDRIRTASNPNSPDAMETMANEARGLDTSGVRMDANPETLATGAAVGAGAAMAGSQPDELNDLESQLAYGQISEDEFNRRYAELQGASGQGTTSTAQPAAGNDTDSPQDRQTAPTPITNNSSGDDYKEHKKQLADNFKKAVNRRWVAAGGLKGVAKKAGKGYVKAVGAVTGAALGVGMGAVGGELGDMWKGGAAGLAGGAFAGSKASQAGSAVANSSVGRFAGEVVHGDNYQKHQFVKQYMKNPENTQRILEKKPNISSKDLKETLEAQAGMAYDAKLTDYSTIKGAVSLEKDLKAEGVANSHEMAVATAKMAKNYDNSTFTDEKKFQNAKAQLQKKLEKQMEEQIKKQFANIQDETERNNRINKANSKVSAQAGLEAQKTLERISKIKGI